MVSYQQTSILLCEWFQKNARVLPWRHGDSAYQVWISEIMLQQTQVSVVIDYFQKFTEEFPTIAELANADLDKVLSFWSGLGYYSRARNLHKCAKLICEEYDQVFPRNYADLLNLPGIGPYTAAAICSFAFKQKQAVIDGNVKRVLSRLFTIKGALNSSAFLKEVEKRLNLCLDASLQAYIFSEAVMELGALVCSPKSPKCTICPLNGQCNSFKTNSQSDFPQPKIRKERKLVKRAALLISNAEGYIWLERRQEKGLFGGLYEVPNQELQVDLPLQNNYEYLLKKRGIIGRDFEFSKVQIITRTLTHIKLEFHLSKIVISKQSHFWKNPNELQSIGISNAMKALIHNVK